MKKIQIIIIGLFVLIQYGYSSKEEIRAELVKSLLAERSDSISQMMQTAFLESKDYGKNPFTFYEVIAIHLIAGQHEFVLNVDSLNYYKSNQYQRYIAIPRDGLYLNMQDIMRRYLHSELFDKRLKLLNLNDRTFLKIFTLSLDSITQEEMNDYLEKNIDHVTNQRQREYLINHLWYKQELGKWKFYIDIGGGADRFINGAEKVLHSTGHMDFGFRLCIRDICPEYEMAIINSRSKVDIKQGGYTFPKESGPQMIMSKITVGLKTFEVPRFENMLYAGIALTPFGIAEKQKDDYDIEVQSGIMLEQALMHI